MFVSSKSTSGFLVTMFPLYSCVINQSPNHGSAVTPWAEMIDWLLLTGGVP